MLNKKQNKNTALNKWHWLYRMIIFQPKVKKKFNEYYAKRSYIQPFFVFENSVVWLSSMDILSSIYISLCIPAFIDDAPVPFFTLLILVELEFYSIILFRVIILLCLRRVVMFRSRILFMKQNLPPSSLWRSVSCISFFSVSIYFLIYMDLFSCFDFVVFFSKWIFCVL